jgi:hypothetical protein
MLRDGRTNNRGFLSVPVEGADARLEKSGTLG